MTKCTFGIHKWGNWTDPVTAEWYMLDSYANKVTEFKALTQHRTCQQCGKTESRRVK